MIVLVGGEMAVKVLLTGTGACAGAVEAVEEVGTTDVVVIGVADAADA